MKLSKYYCPRCGSRQLLEEGYYFICKDCSRFFYLYGAENGMLNGWDAGKAEEFHIKEWEKRQVPQGCLKVKKEQSLKKNRV